MGLLCGLVLLLLRVSECGCASGCCVLAIPCCTLTLLSVQRHNAHIREAAAPTAFASAVSDVAQQLTATSMQLRKLTSRTCCVVCV